MTDRHFGKREKLIESARLEFSLHYYQQASLNTILQNSDVGKGNFYYHFKNKEQLYEAVIRDLAGKKLEFFSSREEVRESLDKPIFEQLRILGELSELFTCSDPVIEGLVYHITTEPLLQARRIAEGVLDTDSRSYFLDIVHRGQSTGEIRDDIPALFEAELLGFLFSSFSRAFGSYSSDGHLDAEAILQKFSWYMDVIERGLKG